MATVITLVWAQDRVGAIGRQNAIPWRVPEDMRRFRELTGTDPVVMGRKTWESLPERFRPLPERRNVVITRNGDYVAPGAEIAGSLREALDRIVGAVTVMGGGAIYEAAMEHATRLHVTEIDLLVEGADAFAPEIDPYGWEVAETTSWETSSGGLRYRFVDYSRHGATSDVRRGA